MPEHEAIDLTAEDVSQPTWDELILVMMGKDRAAGEDGAAHKSPIPPCEGGSCTCVTIDCVSYSAYCV